MRALTVLLFVATFGMVGCYGGAVGEPCTGETDCEMGLRCLESLGVCTVSCANTSCEKGSCILTSHGQLCLIECENEEDCEGNLSCKQAPGGPQKVCWGAEITSGPAKVEATRYEVIRDLNEDSLASPGESLTLEIWARNPGAHSLDGVWASVGPLSPLPIDSCTASGSFCEEDEDYCTCETSSTTFYLEPGEEENLIDVRVNLPKALVPGTYTLPLLFGEENGGQWSDEIEIEIQTPAISLSIAETVVQDEVNDDRQVSPGERVILEFFPQNTGTTPAHSVRPYVEAPEGFSTDTCTQNGAYCRAGERSCDCSESHTPSYLEPGVIDDQDIMRMVLIPSASLSPGSYPLHFSMTDELGNQWEETLELELVEDPSTIQIHHMELEDQNGDGKLSVGETGKARLWLENTGTVASYGTWAEASAQSQHLNRGTCSLNHGRYICSGCQCDYHATTVLAGSTSEYPLIEFDLTGVEAGQGSVPLIFHNELDTTWYETLNVEVIP